MISNDNKDNLEQKPAIPLPNMETTVKNTVESIQGTDNKQQPKKATEPSRLKITYFIKNKFGIIKKITGQQVMSIGTIILALCAVVGIWFNLVQTRDSTKTNAIIFAKMDSISKSFKTLADASKKSDLLSENALNNSEKSFEIENRAFISYEFKQMNGENDGYLPTFTTHLINLGHTPATIFSYITRQKFISADEFNKMEKAPNLDRFQINHWENIVIGANQTFPIVSNTETKIPNDTQEKLNYLKVKRYIWGDILYRDFFGKEHHTHFCGFLDRDVFTPLGAYNDAD